MAMTTYLKNKLLDHFLGTTSYTMPSTVYLGLYTAAPNAGGGGTEVSGGGYTRMAITWSAASSGSKANNALVSFPTATANWGTITHVGIFDASTGGNLLDYDDLATAQTINTNDKIEFASGTGYTITIS